MKLVKARQGANRPYTDALTHEFEMVDAIKEILARRDAQIDLARTKLSIDKFIDPSIDVDVTMAAL